MRKIRLKRGSSSDEGTFGELECGTDTFFTGELPWRGNQISISCIPKGTYICFSQYSPRLKKLAYGIENVPGRSGVRIHAANFMGDREKGLKSQLNGCIALGLKMGRMEGQKALLLSAPAVRQFEALMGGEPFELEIL